MKKDLKTSTAQISEKVYSSILMEASYAIQSLDHVLFDYVMILKVQDKG